MNWELVTLTMLPIVILVLLGRLIKYSRLISSSAVDDLKKMVVNIVLPAVFFPAFLSIDLHIEYLPLFFITPLLCLVMLGVGFLFVAFVSQKKRQKSIRRYVFERYLFTGFEAGMVGISLFSAVYGARQVGVIGIFGLGHEFFIWFILVGLLTFERQRLHRELHRELYSEMVPIGSGGKISTESVMNQSGETNDGAAVLKKSLKQFLSSPVIIAILSGFTLNLMGAREFLYDNTFFMGVLAAMEYLAGMVVPLILIIIGYGLFVSLGNVRRGLRVVMIRLGVMVPVALFLNRVLISGYLGLDPVFEHALFLFLTLPPPFIIPIYMPAGYTGYEEELGYVNTILSLHTLLSLGCFFIYYAFTGV